MARRITIVLLVALGVLASAVPAQANRRPCPGSAALPGQASPGALASTTLCLLNNERHARGQRRLRMNLRLSAAAISHTADMVRNQYFEHVDARGRNVVDRLLGTGYILPTVSWVVGENIAWGSGVLSSPRVIMRNWMNSPGHRRNILNRRYREIGIGVVTGAPQAGIRGVAATYTTVFGVRR